MSKSENKINTILVSKHGQELIKDLENEYSMYKEVKFESRFSFLILYHESKQLTQNKISAASTQINLLGTLLFSGALALFVAFVDEDNFVDGFIYLGLLSFGFFVFTYLVQKKVEKQVSENAFYEMIRELID